LRAALSPSELRTSVRYPDDGARQAGASNSRIMEFCKFAVRIQVCESLRPVCLEVDRGESRTLCHKDLIDGGTRSPSGGLCGVGGRRGQLRGLDEWLSARPVLLIATPVLEIRSANRWGIRLHGEAIPRQGVSIGSAQSCIGMTGVPAPATPALPIGPLAHHLAGFCLHLSCVAMIVSVRPTEAAHSHPGTQ
jgi:hypothetical protein